MRTLALAAFVSSFAVVSARAQPSVEGCWPGQTWSSDARACEGTPRCPSGWRADGENCVLALDAAPEVAAPGPPGDEADEPDETAIDHGLVGAGVASFLTGYTISLLYVVWQSFGTGDWCRERSRPLAALPALGALVSLVAFDTCGSFHEDLAGEWGAVVAITSAQVVGLVLFVIGLVERHPVVGAIEF
ncbi:hypothetical protein [Sandaracinus amylolyticus]|uniref:hypothetical protein n=1 Tax=Sandaracinus amylolyticus TaxID=927083 RepID=UPI001F229366|nr:hypothetical protein [Sandaracinus amylolyticus]UJR81691.1 Hypothetical protein I5071_37510 [Sandaracinus amylolyticus]